jgi:Domain of unknown function (DUF5753)
MMTKRTAVGSASFWIFDNNLVALETPTASIEVTRPQEIRVYAQMFEHLKSAALHGREARALIRKALNELSKRNLSQQYGRRCGPPPNVTSMKQAGIIALNLLHRDGKSCR